MDKNIIFFYNTDQTIAMKKSQFFFLILNDGLHSFHIP